MPTTDSPGEKPSSYEFSPEIPKTARESLASGVAAMIPTMFAAFAAAVAVGVAPGFFWARLLVPTRDLYIRIAFSAALSLALVPAFAALLTKTLGSSVTFAIAVAAPSLVFLTGLAASLLFGKAEVGKNAPASGKVAPMSGYALALFAPAVGLALLAFFGVAPANSTLLPIAILIAFAGAAHALAPLREAGGTPFREIPISGDPSAGRRSDGTSPRHGWDAMRPPGSGIVRLALLPVVLALVLCRYYLGVVLHDWPYLRGGDLYSHAVMANRMMEEGEILPYLVYPPGFHTMTGILARLTNLDPLELFPILIPTLMALPPLALYALAAKLWGWKYGVAAAAISGLALGSTYAYFDVAMYPNVTSSQFLLPMAVAALVFMYARPTLRSAALVALLGASIVLYHPVGSLYTAALLGAIGILFVPYLLLKAFLGRANRPGDAEEREPGDHGKFVGRESAGKGEAENISDSRRISGGFLKSAAALLGAFAMLGVLAVAYAWETYDLPGIFVGFLEGSETGSGGYAVASAVGTQGTLPLEHLLDSITTPVLWLGLLGAFLLLFAKNDGVPGFLSRYTLLLWAIILFVGSRTALSGFPIRFERDLGMPLALLAAFALGSLVKSPADFRAGRRATFAVAVASASLVIVLVGAQIFKSFEDAAEAPEIFLMTPEIAEAGAWLRSHNEGGNIIVGPHQNQVPSRAMLAMGDYSALQSFTPSRISYDRDLPPHGPEPMWDVLRAINNPTGERTERILDEYDVRHVVFYKRFDPETTWGSVATVEWWRGYETSPELYEKTFENEGVVIFEPTFRAEASR